MRDVMIKLTKKDSDEHRIYQELLHCSELSGKDFQGVLPPVAILDSDHDFSFIVMPRCVRWTIPSRIMTHVVQMGRLRPTRNPGDRRRSFDPDAMFAQGENIASARAPWLNSVQGLAFLHGHQIVHRVRLVRFLVGGCAANNTPNRISTSTI